MDGLKIVSIAVLSQYTGAYGDGQFFLWPRNSELQQIDCKNNKGSCVEERIG
jgi:hypothetical protein